MFSLDLDSWNTLMVVSLGVAALAAVAVGISTAVIIKLQKEEGIESANEFTRYKLEANKVIAAAELKTEQLRKELGPRRIQREIFLKALEGQPRANVQILYLRDDPECFDLAQQIWRLLEDARWTVTTPAPIPQNDSSTALQSPSAMSVDGQPSGVTVVTNAVTQSESEASMKQMLGESWERTPWTVLMYAFGQSLGKIGGHGGGLNKPPVGLLRVVVAPR